MFRVSLALAILIALTAPAAAADFETPRPSPKASVSQTVGTTQVTLTFSRPGVKGRVIWGELVPHDEMWRTGANESTTLELSGPVSLNGHSVEAGRYSLSTIPTEGEWTVILNSATDLWGTGGYSNEKDVLRFQVAPETGPMTERMTFAFPEVGFGSARLELRWEKLVLPLTIEVGHIEETITAARSAVEEALEEGWVVPYRAARFAYSEKVATQDAVEWIRRSVQVETNSRNLALQSRLLARAGEYPRAIIAAKKAIELGQRDERDMSDLKEELERWRNR